MRPLTWTFSASRPMLGQADGSPATRGQAQRWFCAVLSLRVCAADTRRGAGGRLPCGPGVRLELARVLQKCARSGHGAQGEARRGVPHGAPRNDDGCGLHGHRRLRSGQRGKAPGAQGAVWVGTGNLESQVL